MSIKRYIANKDTCITNAYKPNMITQATGSNQGESDTLQTFKIFAQQASASAEECRILLDFPISQMIIDRADGVIPASGSCEFILRMFNCEHSFTVPYDYTMTVLPVSRSWSEGYGIDADGFSDEGICNWEEASSGSTGITDWSIEGGDYHTGSYFLTAEEGSNSHTLPTYKKYFETGLEDLELNITSLVEEWFVADGSDSTHAREPYGVAVFVSSSIIWDYLLPELFGYQTYYVKKFFGRGSEYFFKRPMIEVRWDDSRKDNRGNCHLSSSFLLYDDNLNRLYLYNFFRGQLRDVPGHGDGGYEMHVNLYSITSSDDSTYYDISPSETIHGTWLSTGIYSCSFMITSSEASTFIDVWSAANGDQFFTGSESYIYPLRVDQYNPNKRYVASITNLKSEYRRIEKARFRIFTREYDWNPTIYTKAYTNNVELSYIEDLYYQIRRVIDDEIVVDYGTGSFNETRCSYDISGSYFDFDMSLLESNYMYEISLKYKDLTDIDYKEIEDKFRFRVS